MNKMEDKNIIYGRNSIIEALKSGRRNFNKIIISRSVRPDAKIDKIKEYAANAGIPFVFAEKEKFSKYNEYNHQGVIAFVSPIEYVELEDFIAQHKENTSLVLLDGVEDPHNIGAVIRTCVCAGIDGIILPSRRGALVSEIVEKTSAGAINHISIIKVNSPVSALQKLKDNNWWVIASDHHADNNYYDIDFLNMNFVLVMGAEHAGISRSILKLADFKIKIPMLTDFNSLNVSAAAGIIIYEYVRQKLTAGRKYEQK